MMTYDEFRMRLTDNICTQMRRRKVNQTQLAVYAGVSLGTITGIISGNRDPNLYTLWAVANALKLTPEELCAEDFNKVIRKVRK